MKELSLKKEQNQNLNYQRNELQENILSIKSQLSKLSDKESNFRKKILNMHDCLNAMDWMQKNRHRLQGLCYGPVGMFIDVRI